jgi:hypothetical protein
MPKVNILEHFGVINRDFRAERRICEHVVKYTAPTTPVFLERSSGVESTPTDPVFQTIETEYISMAVIIHDHVHARGFTQLRVNVDTVEAWSVRH